MKNLVCNVLADRMVVGKEMCNVLAVKPVVIEGLTMPGKAMHYGMVAVNKVNDYAFKITNFVDKLIDNLTNFNNTVLINTKLYDFANKGIDLLDNLNNFTANAAYKINNFIMDIANAADNVANAYVTVKDAWNTMRDIVTNDGVIQKVVELCKPVIQRLVNFLIARPVQKLLK